MNAITVYCASSTYLDPDFHGPARAVGAEIARRGLRLVYGGGGIGLMGEVARAAKDHGGTVIGVITKYLLDREQGWDGADEMVVADNMRERKKIMEQRGDGFIILPGGLGTYEEFFEILVGRQLREHNKPIGIVNSHGYFNPLIAMIEHGVEHRFIKAAISELFVIDPDPVKVVDSVIDAPPVEIEDERFLPMGEK